MPAEQAAGMILGNTLLRPEGPTVAPARLAVTGPDGVGHPAATGPVTAGWNDEDIKDVAVDRRSGRSADVSLPALLCPPMRSAAK